MSGAEQTQEQGRIGVSEVKRWLESTLRFELIYDVYTQTLRTTLKTLDGKKRFDLRGLHYDERYENPQDFYVEVKYVTTDSNLSGQWIDFVATAYSATHYMWEELGEDPQLQFMFASTHAWSSSKYYAMTDHDSVLEACKSRPDLMPEGGPVEDRVRALAPRLFLWVIPRRQDDMTMSRAFRADVIRIINERP
jgi:hypothetical protein